MTRRSVWSLSSLPPTPQGVICLRKDRHIAGLQCRAHCHPEPPWLPCRPPASQPRNVAKGEPVWPSFPLPHAKYVHSFEYHFPLSKFLPTLFQNVNYSLSTMFPALPLFWAGKSDNSSHELQLPAELFLSSGMTEERCCAQKVQLMCGCSTPPAETICLKDITISYNGILKHFHSSMLPSCNLLEH